jgi:hypothetical protein
MFPLTQPSVSALDPLDKRSPISNEPQEWNVWIDSRGVTSSDHRFGLDFDGRLGDIYAGVDIRAQPGLVLGLAIGGEFWTAREFQGTLRTSLNSFVVGPYAAIRLTDWLMFDSWLGYAPGRQTLDVADFRGTRSQQRVFGSFNLTAQTWLGGWRIQPKLSAYVSSYEDGSFNLAATPGLFSAPTSLLVHRSKDGVALTEASLDIAYPIRLNETTVVVPNIRPGIAFDANRPNSGRVITGTLQIAEPGRAWGMIQAGLQLKIGNQTELDLSGGYDSIGQPGLHVWTGRVAARIAF